MGKIRQLSDEQREKLAGSRENLLSAAKCIDELLGGHDIRDVPFEHDALVELMRRAEGPSKRILRKVFNLDDSEYMDFPEYDEGVFWGEYIPSLGNEVEIETLRLRHGSREDGMERAIAEVAKARGVSTSRARQTLDKIYGKLRRRSRLEILFPCHKALLTDAMRECDAVTRMAEANLDEVRELQRRYRHIGQMNDIAEDCLATLRDMGRELEREPIGTASRDLSLEDLPTGLELSTRALNCLKRCRIFTLGDLLDSGIEKKSNLLGIRHMGVKSAEEVARVMRHYGAPITEN